MRIEEIKELMSHMKSTGLTNFEYEGQGIKVKMGVETTVVTASAPMVAPAVMETAVQSKAISSPTAEVVEVASMTGEVVESPIVGVFYEAPGPDKPVFVEAGDTVKKGEVLCIVEAMKVMNEIVAEKDCKILKVLCDNEAVVEYGQPLFEIEAL